MSQFNTYIYIFIYIFIYTHMLYIHKLQTVAVYIKTILFVDHKLYFAEVMSSDNTVAYYSETFVAY